ncbi:hypothetical protein GCM10020367_60250 [Streptomyces sannanensis]|uniref:Uncharacterized protein n=1 Tax=Streptomyces sannanensis TaxID=285536 RepID=A0ABP6SKT1_9ACTN
MTARNLYAPEELQTPQSFQTRSLGRLTLLEAADFLRARSRGATFAMPYMAAEACFAHDRAIGGDKFIESRLELARAMGLHAPFWAHITDYRDGADVVYTSGEADRLYGVMGIVLYPDGDAPGEGHTHWRTVDMWSGTYATERNYLYYSMRWEHRDGCRAVVPGPRS